MTQEDFDKLISDGDVVAFIDENGNNGFIYKENVFDPRKLPSTIKVAYIQRCLKDD